MGRRLPSMRVLSKAPGQSANPVPSRAMVTSRAEASPGVDQDLLRFSVKPEMDDLGATCTGFAWRCPRSKAERNGGGRRLPVTS